MVDTMMVLGAAASAKLAGDRIVRDIVVYIRETRIAASAQPAQKPTRQERRRKPRLARSFKASTSGLGRRPSSSTRLSRKVSLMTDAELEAELENRRRHRAKEREMYSRAMRSDKLASLESELANLRREIGRIDAVPSRLSSRGGTPHTVRWEPLPRSHRDDLRPSSATGSGNASTHPYASSNPSPTSGPPPPPPPPPPPGAGDDDEDLTIDPEQRKREKAERQKRREAKKKEREQSQKKLTLADIIRSAGADPIKRLKPAGKKPADAEQEEFERQTREREDREKRQEEERIALEKKSLQNMGRRAAEGSPSKDEESPMPSEKEGTEEESDAQMGHKAAEGAPSKDEESRTPSEREGAENGDDSQTAAASPKKPAEVTDPVEEVDTAMASATDSRNTASAGKDETKQFPTDVSKFGTRLEDPLASEKLVKEKKSPLKSSEKLPPGSDSPVSSPEQSRRQEEHKSTND